MRRPLTLHAFSACCLLACGEVPLDAVSPPASDVGEDLADGLVAHWSLDESAGAVAADSSGHDHHGELSGGSWILDGRFAGALRLVPGDAVSVTSFPDASPGSVYALLAAFAIAITAFSLPVW